MGTGYHIEFTLGTDQLHSVVDSGINSLVESFLSLIIQLVPHPIEGFLIRLGSHFIIAGIFLGSFDLFFTHFFPSHFLAFALKASFYSCPEAVFLPYIQQNIQQTIHSSFHFLTEKG